MVSAWQEPPSVIPAEWSAEATAVGRCRRHSNQSLGLERRCHTVAYLGLLRLRPGPAREVFWTWPWEPPAACQTGGSICRPEHDLEKLSTDTVGRSPV